MLFDPDAPVRYHIGAELLGRYKVTPLTAISGSLRKPITGTIDKVSRGPNRAFLMSGPILCITTEILAQIYLSIF